MCVSPKGISDFANISCVNIKLSKIMLIISLVFAYTRKLRINQRIYAEKQVQRPFWMLFLFIQIMDMQMYINLEKMKQKQGEADIEP